MSGCEHEMLLAGPATDTEGWRRCSYSVRLASCHDTRSAPYRVRTQCDAVCTIAADARVQHWPMLLLLLLLLGARRRAKHISITAADQTDSDDRAAAAATCDGTAHRTLSAAPSQAS